MTCLYAKARSQKAEVKSRPVAPPAAPVHQHGEKS